MLTRRQFSKTVLGASLLTKGNGLDAFTRSPDSPQNQTKNDVFDLLIKGGTVIDPGQNLHAPLDVAITNGKIAELSSDIPAARARRVFSVENKLVTPGLIDIHVHVFEGVGAPGVNADHYCISRGVTTAVDAGSAGYPTISGFRKYVINTSATRIYALVDVGALGLVVRAQHSMENLEWVNPQLTAQAALANRPAVVGIKVRLGKNIEGPTSDLECLRRAREAAEASSLPLMVHIGDPSSPLKDILSLMKRGDILTHCYNSLPHGLLDANGQIESDVWEARQRGIFFDVGHGTNHFSFNVAEKCLQQNFLADTISSDLSSSVSEGPVFDLPTTVSKFLALGLSVNKVIELTTINASRVLKFDRQLGVLQVGSEADISIFDLLEGSFVYVDSTGDKRTGRQKLVSSATVCAGKLSSNQAD